MEYEMVTIRLPRVLVQAGVEIVVKAPSGSGCVFAEEQDQSTGDRLYLLMCPIVAGETSGGLKPDWKPPRLKKGWLTWDITGGWWWWSGRPYHTGKFEGWVHSESRCGNGGEQIGEVMAELLGCPDCTGFDERECIWEVG